MKKLSYLLVVNLLLITSCADETTIFEDQKDNLSVEDNQSFLVESVNLDNAGVLSITSDDKIAGKTTKIGDELAGNYPLSLIAQIVPPSFKGGENLTASHVTIDGDIAYVTYNTVDDVYVGAVDAINVRDPFKPRIVSRLYYTNADINSVAYENGFIYAVGGVDSEKSVRATSNSFVAKIPCSNGFININGGITYGFQEGFVGTDIRISGNQLFVSSGNDGSLTIYDKNSLKILKDIPFPDLRSVASKNNLIAVLDAKTGVSLFDENFNLLKEISISSDFGKAAKRTLDFSDERIIVAEGSKGAGIYELNSGRLMSHIPILINPENSSSSNNVTNAVAVNEDAILMANGGAGLSLSEETSENAKPLGIIDLDGSINYVASKGDFIFAASGKAGLQIIKMNKPQPSLVNKCVALSRYNGSANLNVNSGQKLAFAGSKSFNALNVNGELLLCGSWTVRNAININSNSVFEMNGSLMVGKNNDRKNITVNSNATFRVEGSLVIYGDLILNDGATLEFVGENSNVHISGKVRKAETAIVKGNFKDEANKF
jgi:hypothetical protein